MEAKKTNLVSDIVFKIFKFEISDNMIGWEPMPGNANQK